MVTSSPNSRADIDSQHVPRKFRGSFLDACTSHSSSSSSAGGTSHHENTNIDNNSSLLSGTNKEDASCDRERIKKGRYTSQTVLNSLRGSPQKGQHASSRAHNHSPAALPPPPSLPLATCSFAAGKRRALIILNLVTLRVRS